MIPTWIEIDMKQSLWNQSFSKAPILKSKNIPRHVKPNLVSVHHATVGFLEFKWNETGWKVHEKKGCLFVELSYIIDLKEKVVSFDNHWLVQKIESAVTTSACSPRIHYVKKEKEKKSEKPVVSYISNTIDPPNQHTPLQNGTRYT
jgi:hypothetical protein